MVTTVQLEQQVRKAAALLLFEFRSRCYNLSCKWNCRNDLLPRLHNSLALYLGAQLCTGCPHSREKALSSLLTYQFVLGERITGSSSKEELMKTLFPLGQAVCKAVH